MQCGEKDQQSAADAVVSRRGDEVDEGHGGQGRRVWSKRGVVPEGIDEIAQSFMAKQGILAARRIKKSDIEKLSRATGGRIITNLEDMRASDLGGAGLVE